MQKKYYEELQAWFNNTGEKEIYKAMNKWRGKISINSDVFFAFARAYLSNDLILSNSLLKDNKSIEILFKRIDLKYSEFIEDIREEFNEDQLKSIVLNFRINRHIERRGMSPNLYIPSGLRKLAYSLLQIKDGDKVLQPYCMEGDFIKNYLIQFPNSLISGLDISTDNVLMSLIKASIIAEEPTVCDFSQGDYLNVDFSKIKCNKIFGLPPFNIPPRHIKEKIQDENLISFYEDNKLGSYSDWIYLLKAVENSNLERAVFVVTSNILFNKKDAQIRKYLAEQGLIEGIIELPPRLLEGTGITTNIVVLSKDNKSIRMVNASEVFKKERSCNILDTDSVQKIIKYYSEDSDNSNAVSLSELEENDFSFLPRRYTAEELKMEDFIYLKDVADIRRGYANIKQNELNERFSDKDTGIKLLTAGDISDEFAFENLANITRIEENEKVYCLDNGEIAFSRGGNYNSVLINKGDETLLANGTLYIIHCNEEKMNPYYLQMYLSSDHCSKQISALNAGTVISFISISQLGDLKIPRVSKKIEDEISQKYKSILGRYEIIRIQKKNLEEETKDLISEVL